MHEYAVEVIRLEARVAHAEVVPMMTHASIL